jgi:hypothetical protein
MSHTSNSTNNGNNTNNVNNGNNDDTANINDINNVIVGSTDNIVICDAITNDSGSSNIISETITLQDSDTIMVSIDCKLDAVEWHTFAAKTAKQLKSTFPNNKILILHSSMAVTIVKQ